VLAIALKRASWTSLRQLSGWQSSAVVVVAVAAPRRRSSAPRLENPILEKFHCNDSENKGKASVCGNQKE
jgi:hypothetical protein